jgi:hypothetical protein
VLVLVWRGRRIAKSGIFRRDCPSALNEQLGSHWKDFREIWYLNIFRQSVENIHVWLKSGKVYPLPPELNLSAQRCLTRFFTGNFSS